jgi:uncharacterized repeat protein (TIGR01451 family)
VTMTAPKFPGAGSTFDYVITVTNHGPATATGVSVSTFVPTGTSFVAVSDDGRRRGSSIDWMVLALESGETRTFRLTVTATAAKNTTVKNTAFTSGNEPDGNTDNNVATVSSLTK